MRSSAEAEGPRDTYEISHLKRLAIFKDTQHHYIVFKGHFFQNGNCSSEHQ